jgi:hypothetical protein
MPLIDPIPAGQAPTLLKGGHLATDPRLGRLPEFDSRSRRYPARALLAEQTGTERPPLRSYSWPMPWETLNQQRTGHCVGFGHGGRIKGTPDRHAEVDDPWCHDYYHRCQQLDEWAGEEPAYEGTSVLAGAKTGAERGYYESYHWAFGIDDTALAIGYLGPVVLGVWWFDSMMEPRPSGLLEVGGSVAGGHCILARGVRLRAVLPGESARPLEVVRLRNSWGPGWGPLKGDAYIKLDDLERLLRLDGEACIPVEPGQHRKQVEDVQLPGTGA